MKHFKNSGLGGRLLAKCAAFKVVGLAVVVGVVYCFSFCAVDKSSKPIGDAEFYHTVESFSFTDEILQGLNDHPTVFSMSHPTKEKIEDELCEYIKGRLDIIASEISLDGYIIVDVQLHNVKEGKIREGEYKGDVAVSTISPNGYFNSQSLCNLTVHIDRGFYTWIVHED